MSKTLSIALLALAAVGAWSGHRIGRSGSAAIDPTIAPLPKPRPAVELVRLLNEGTTEAGYYALRRELDALPFADLQALFEETANDKERDSEFREVMSAMLNRAPETTIDLVRQHLSGLKRSHAWYRIIGQWGYADPHATLALVAGLDESEDHSCNVLNSTTSFLQQWAEREPKEALAAWLALPEPKFANESNIPYSAECLAMGLAGDPEMRGTALEMLLEQAPSEGRAGAIAGVLSRWASEAPFDEITTWLAAHKLTPPESNTVAVNAATTAAQRGNRAAADWLVEHVFATQESSSDRANHLDRFAEEWSREDPNACAEWLTTLAPGNETDWAIRGFLRQVEYRDPESGFHWARQITGENLRKRQAQEFWNHWRRVAPVAAQEYIPQLTPAEREWLRIDG